MLSVLQGTFGCSTSSDHRCYTTLLDVRHPGESTVYTAYVHGWKLHVAIDEWGFLVLSSHSVDCSATKSQKVNVICRVCCCVERLRAKPALKLSTCVCPGLLPSSCFCPAGIFLKSDESFLTPSQSWRRAVRRSHRARGSQTLSWGILPCWIHPRRATARWPVTFTRHFVQNGLKVQRVDELWGLVLKLSRHCLLRVITCFTTKRLPWASISALWSIWFNLAIFFWENSRNAPKTHSKGLFSLTLN